jgi:cytochrome c oxidase assembly factor CtaG
VLRLIGKAFVLLASMALLTGVSLFIIGAYMISWPILRQSPRTRRKQAASQLAVSLFTLAQAFQSEHSDDDEADTPSESR